MSIVETPAVESVGMDQAELEKLSELRQTLGQMHEVDYSVCSIVNIADIIAERPDAKERARVIAGLIAMQELIAKAVELSRSI
jgi:hypothetical protein